MSEQQIGSGRAGERWVIRNDSGELLQELAMNNDKIKLSWLRQEFLAATGEGKKPPFGFDSEDKALAMLHAFQTLLPRAFDQCAVILESDNIKP